jgi:hypothetical protein
MFDLYNLISKVSQFKYAIAHSLYINTVITYKGPIFFYSCEEMTQTQKYCWNPCFICTLTYLSCCVLSWQFQWLLWYGSLKHSHRALLEHNRGSIVEGKIDYDFRSSQPQNCSRNKSMHIEDLGIFLFFSK